MCHLKIINSFTNLYRKLTTPFVERTNYLQNVQIKYLNYSLLQNAQTWWYNRRICSEGSGNIFATSEKLFGWTGRTSGNRFVGQAK